MLWPRHETGALLKECCLQAFCPESHNIVLDCRAGGKISALYHKLVARAQNKEAVKDAYWPGHFCFTPS